MKPLHVELAVPVTTLVLIGGGEFSFGETREIDEMLLRSMPAGRRTVAFLPTASGSAEYAAHLGAYFKTIDPAVETVNVPVYRGRDNRRPRNVNALLAAGMIYIGGGVTNNLLDTLPQSAAEIAIRDAAEFGSVVAAIGAAAACFGTHARNMRGAGSALPALGWLAHTVIDTAFDPENDTMLRRLMSIEGTELGIGIPPKCALVIRGDGSTEIAGSGSIAVFRKG